MSQTPESNRLEAVAAGKRTDAVIHERVLNAEPSIELQHFSLWYGKKQALHEVTMPIPRGQVTALVGPSGCGKTTLLRSVNRMTDFMDGLTIRGDILLNGKSIFDVSSDPIELRREMGMVFQDPNPFPMSVFENVVYPLRIAGIRQRAQLNTICEKSLKRAALWDEVRERLSESGLDLSGGQQQRLCIARAIATEPSLLLLDEPCSALDPLATRKIEDLISELRGEYSILIVTHNMQQAARISDNTAFIYLGRLIEYGPTSQIFTKPFLQETEDYVTGRLG
ncbi:MAG: phosphate ABC transporter ATP-binding protein PstB [Planctomycetota bacterium]